MLDWLVMTLDRSSSISDLQRMFAPLFSLLGRPAVRAQACYLLCRLARRSDVLPFRVRQLQALAERYPGDHALAALLVVFKEYAPAISFELPARFSMHRAFKVPDRAFVEAMESVARAVERKEKGLEQQSSQQQREEEQQQQGALGKQNPLMATGISGSNTAVGNASGGGGGAGGGATTASASASRVPRASNMSSSAMLLIAEGASGSPVGAVTASEIRTVEDLCANITRAVLPDQVASLLESRAVQHLFVLHCGDPAVRAQLSARLSHWLGFHLAQLFFWRDANPRTLADQSRFLAQVARACSFLRETVGEVDRFLVDYLVRWDGTSNMAALLTLVEHINPRPFEVIGFYFAPHTHIYMFIINRIFDDDNDDYVNDDNDHDNNDHDHTNAATDHALTPNTSMRRRHHPPGPPRRIPQAPDPCLPVRIHRDQGSYIDLPYCSRG